MTEHATYGWLITKHNTEDDDELNREGMAGPRAIDPALEARLRSGEGEEFRMRYNDMDDDSPESLAADTVYYGRALHVSGDHAYYTEDPFGPLDDLGIPDSGCTVIEWLVDDKWLEP